MYRRGKAAVWNGKEMSLLQRSVHNYTVTKSKQSSEYMSSPTSGRGYGQKL